MNWLIAFVTCGAILISSLVSQAAGTEGPLTESYDQNELHITWRNMANEQVMYPLQMKEIPVKIGTERQLFLDNYLIAEAENVTLQVREPQRFEGNPVLRPPKAKFNHAVVQQVLQFEKPPRFRMWYCSWDNWHTLESGQEVRFATSYATSDDGIHWKKPALDLYKIAGLDERNVVIPYGLMHGLFYEPDEPDPEKRFKALVCVEGRNPVIPEGYYLHTSPDGIHWKGDLSRYLIPSLTGYDVPQSGIGDTTRFWWDPLRKKYIGDVKFVLPGKLRCRGIMESDDLVHWTRPHPTFFARAADAQIYGHFGFVYQGMYVGTRWIFLPKYSGRHSSYVELDCSRDGLVWTRVGAGQPFMGFNPKHDTWDASIVRPISMLEVGNEVWIYYFAAPTEREINNPKYPKSLPVEWSAGLAKLPRDRFASINGGEKTGALVTRPLDFQGQTLHVNADVSKDGELRVAVLKRDGTPILGYDNKDCAPLKGNSIDMPVSWQDKSKLEDLTNSAVRFRFWLRNAKLFSFWIE